MATKKKASKAKKPAPKKIASTRSAASSASKPSSFSTHSPKSMFLDSFQKEHATTMKVIRALPPSQSEFRPHPRSQSARELTFTFVMEQGLISKTIKDQFKLGGGMPKTPDDFIMIVDQFESDYNALVDLIKNAPDKAFEGTIDFPTGPGKIGAWPKMEFIWFMLRDQIHHRGQLSVYVKMAGGKVPSIYGPSGDEPWF